MKYFRVSCARGRLNDRWRWLLYAAFDKKAGFCPVNWSEDSDPWTHAWIALDDLGLAGAFRYTRHPDTDELVAGGTWVRPDQRGKGLGVGLWKRGLRGVRWVTVTTISAGGRALVRAMKRQFPKVGFNATK